ncbi:hypothetical protein KGY14_15960, partial [Ameyamaea chiangmaiensis]|nr:hypothetical protein [Ameyamaea chiangmaiensis]NVN42257.1 hypothetical protein [Ameyamaea chiangmaiensis]
LRAEVDAKLAAIGLPPLHGTWCPDWMTEERLVADALETRTRITDASDEPEGYEEDGRTQESPRDHIRMGLEAFLDDRAEELERAGQDGQSYRARYREIALGEVTPIGRLFERWKRDIGTTIKAQTLRGHDLSFRLLGEFLSPEPQERTSSPDPAALIASLNVEHITRRVAGGFPEWLAQDRGLSAKTIQSRISPLKTFWDWLERKG